MILQITSLIVAYLLGSVPSAVWIGRYYYGTDVRKSGSGNPGATNTMRALGRKAGLIVLLLDVSKGYAAVMSVYFFLVFSEGIENLFLMKLLLGTAAVLGHVFPVFTKFKGGKGIATLLGIILAINPLAAGISLGIFIFFFLLSGFVSLASISGVLSFAVYAYFYFHDPKFLLFPFSILFLLIILITHRKNILRLSNRTEPKMRILRRK